MKNTLLIACMFTFVLDMHAQAPTVTFTATPSIICPGDFVNFTNTATNDPLSWTWYMPGSSLSNSFTTIIRPGNPPPVTYENPGTYYVTCVVVNNDGRDSVTVQNCVTVKPCSLGVPEISEKNIITVYPNPSGGQFTFVIASEAKQPQSTIEIYNVLGERVLTETLRSAQGDNLIDISNQPNGVYFYRIITNDGSLLGEGKVVKQ